MSEVTIVGGGIAGLVAAIEAAGAGAPVRLLEAARQLGGRARSEGPPYRTNRGPHALYGGGSFDGWLVAQGLRPPLARPRYAGIRVRHEGRLRRLPLPLLGMWRSRKDEAPVERSYRSWATERMGARAAEAAIGFASLPTFHGDPGELSAAFVHERIQRSLRGPVGYVVGGWQVLVDALAGRARELGVAIETGVKLDALPEAPCVVATDLRAARRLLRDEAVDWPGHRTATLDVALRASRRDPAAVLDLDGRVYCSRYSSADPSLAPAGEELLQCCAGLLPGERLDDGLGRMRAALDAGFPGWRERITWERHALFDAGAGAVDLPGTTWRDRPALARGSDVWLAGDRVAAPGLLSEVAFASGRRAGRDAAAALLGRRSAVRRGPARGAGDGLRAVGG